MTSNQKYREFCNKEESMPIFVKDWWLDAVCGEKNWDVILIEKDGEIIASMPYFKKRMIIFDIITMPKLTQTMGIYIKYPKNQSYVKKLSYEKEVVTEIISKLPRFHIFFQKFNYSLTNWLPFYWAGFKQTTNYTYVIENLSNLDTVFFNFKKNTKGNIKRAQKTLTVISNDDFRKFYEINKYTFKKKGVEVPYSLKYADLIDKACSKRNCRKIFFAVDKNKEYQAAIYVIWDKNSMYYLMGGTNPNNENQGANSLLVWEAIKFASTVTNKFDFEGSMIESVEKYFRTFGSIQKPYFKITKINIKIFYSFKKIIKKIFRKKII